MKIKRYLAAMLVLCMISGMTTPALQTYAADAVYEGCDLYAYADSTETGTDASYAGSTETVTDGAYADSTATDGAYADSTETGTDDACPDATACDDLPAQAWAAELATGLDEITGETLSVDMTTEEFLCRAEAGTLGLPSAGTKTTTASAMSTAEGTTTAATTASATATAEGTTTAATATTASAEGTSTDSTDSYTLYSGAIASPNCAGTGSTVYQVTPRYTDGEITRGAEDTSLSPEGNGTFRYSQLSAEGQAAYLEAAAACNAFESSEAFQQENLTVTAQYDTGGGLTGYTGTGVLMVAHTYSAGASLSHEELINVFAALYYEGYSYFWLSNKYLFMTTADGVVIYMCVDDYYLPCETRCTAQTALAELIDDWYTQLYEIYTDESEGDYATYKAVLRLHDLIINRINYARDDAGDAQTARWAHSIAGIATLQGVVCEGYAKMFSYVLALLGIDALFVVGNGGGESHAWNAVYLDCKEDNTGYYLCDLTWDDPNETNTGDLTSCYYTYFCMPESMFDDRHTPDKSLNWPEFCDNTDYSFYTFFECYASVTLNSTSAATLFDSALANRYEGSDYVHFMVPDSASISMLRYVAGVDVGNFSDTYLYTPWGLMYLFEYVEVTSPATYIHIVDAEDENYDVTLSYELLQNYTEEQQDSYDPDLIYCDWDSETMTYHASVEQVTTTPLNGREIAVYTSRIDLRDTHTFTAQILPADSDDRIYWTCSDTSVATITTSGRTVTVKGRRNGTVELVAHNLGTKGRGYWDCEAVVTLTIGTGGTGAEYFIYAGGSKDNKTVTLTPTISASNWTDAKGKTKTGKLVWLASDTDIDVQFNTTKHTVTSKTTKTHATVNAKGVVTAKKPGYAYIYACDTGSCTYEVYVVEVRTAPSKLTLTRTAGSTQKADILKTVDLNAGSTGLVYITPTSNLGEPDADLSYTVSLAKADQSTYLSFGEVYETDSGYWCFKITALDYDRTKNKAVSVKLNVVNNESGKKTSLTVKIGNPVTAVSAVQTDASSTAGTSGLASKGNTVTLKLSYTTALGSSYTTTDSLKLYVGKTYVRLKSNGKTVETDKGATVSAAVVKGSAEGTAVDILLKARKDASATALIYAMYKDAVTKELKLYELAEVDAEGTVTLK